MHEVQTLSRFGVRPTTARTRWMFGFQRRDVRRCECEMLLPKPGPLPQTSQLAATGHSKSFRIYSEFRRTGIRSLKWLAGGRPGVNRATEAAYNACLGGTKLPRSARTPSRALVTGGPPCSSEAESLGEGLAGSTLR
jgi:hypothetical protein